MPVLAHNFVNGGMDRVEGFLREKQISSTKSASYGGLIFTSQRAVEAFTKLVQDGSSSSSSDDSAWPHLQNIPVYSVGPATTRALKAVQQTPPLQIFGEHTGNGDQLAQFILQHYGEWYQEWSSKPPLLFLVGEQRRDIIPRTLMDTTLPPEQRIQVDEVVVYGSGVMESFATDFRKVLDETALRAERWVVVFSPTGCDTMLKVLGLLTQEGKMASKANRSIRIATIGPTTRDYLVKTFALEPDVCAEKPSPEGIWDGITRFMSTNS